ncbi:hypothetical protein PFDG_05249 [Plasmodium falciparum Dd2]|uniref:Uncharacterized protein n=1 Tax=Plasmodium falciparum (isolate Dd2) TaxID=57267 RepID=A0A0L7MA12_PLAF4|nr:hypothetical protein PFDG_05249 [Plasmodium falciparum Dd2]
MIQILDISEIRRKEETKKKEYAGMLKSYEDLHFCTRYAKEEKHYLINIMIQSMLLLPLVRCVTNYEYWMNCKFSINHIKRILLKTCL